MDGFDDFENDGHKTAHYPNDNEAQFSRQFSGQVSYFLLVYLRVDNFIRQMFFSVFLRNRNIIQIEISVNFAPIFIIVFI